jgi:hypothetical protein
MDYTIVQIGAKQVEVTPAAFEAQHNSAAKAEAFQTPQTK